MSRNIDNAAEALQTFWASVHLLEPPPGVSYYQLGDVDRGPTAQAAAVASRHSRATFGDSPHNFMPAAALDVYAIRAGRVSNLVEDYLPIRDLALAQGLDSGAFWSSPDWPHVQLRGWRAAVRDSAPAEDPPGLLAGLGESATPKAGLVLVLLAVLAWLGMR